MTRPVSLPGPMWFVGCGNMGGAMLEGWLLAGVDPRDLTVIRPSRRDVAPGVRVLSAIPEGEPPPALVLLAVKPQKFQEVAPALAPAMGPDTVLISILAGVEAATLSQAFPSAGAVVRAMPNLPVRIGRGMTALCAKGLTDDRRPLIEQLMRGIGNVLWLEEDRMGAATALIGSAPAFVFRFINALAEAGEAQGLSSHDAAWMAVDVVHGAAEFACTLGQPLDVLVEQVASPKGTTRAGLDVLDADRGLRDLVAHAVAAAVRRGAELTEETRRPG